MRYVFASTGQQVEVPLLPGLTLRGDAWYSRAATPGGFNKTQVLAQEWTMASPTDGTRAATAKGSPRCATLLGASATAGPIDLEPAIMLNGAPSPVKPSTARSSARSPRRPGTTTTTLTSRTARGPANEEAPFTSEASAAFAPESLSPMERPGVLRFAAYFTESTEWAFSGELGTPKDRGVQVRKCLLLYHLEDGTVEVLEERTSNSGVAGGRFFNRAPPSSAGMGWRAQPAPGSASLPDGAPLDGPEGLEVGGELVFLGQTFSIVDADGFTRDWYLTNLQKTQPPPVAYPRTTPREWPGQDVLEAIPERKHASTLFLAFAPRDGRSSKKFSGQRPRCGNQRLTLLPRPQASTTRSTPRASGRRPPASPTARAAASRSSGSRPRPASARSR